MPAASRPGDRVRQRTMPVGSSILWKPLRDSHYVLTSIQPGQGGVRQIFILQSVLDRVRRLACQPSGAHPVGLLLGDRCDCPITGTRYVLIESFEEIGEATGRDSGSMTAALGDRIKRHRGNPSIECLGWYASSEAAEPQVSSAHAAVHRSLFEEPWAAALIVADRGNSGAFFLQDTRASRWFQAPFYEVGNADRKGDAAKPTCIAWPAYLTSETVVPLSSLKLVEAAPPRAIATPKPAPSRRAAGLRAACRWVYQASSRLFVRVLALAGAAARGIRALLKSPAARRAAARARNAADRAKARIADAERKKHARAAHAERLRVAAAARTERERVERERAERQRAERDRAERDRAEREHAERERIERQRARDNAQRQAPQPARAAVVQPDLPTPSPKQGKVAEQPAAAPKQAPPPVANDGEDTTVSDQPYRFLALARREGFQVSANMERAGAKGVETVWLLNESEHGIQVTLVTSDVAVLEANLHYNMRTKDAALLNATRPEHRDLDSRIIYVRESCAVGLRTKCRRLRASGALQRDWKVTPHIYPPGAAGQ